MFLENAKKLSMYGVDLHQAKVGEISSQSTPRSRYMLEEKVWKCCVFICEKRTCRKQEDLEARQVLRLEIRSMSVCIRAGI